MYLPRAFQSLLNLVDSGCFDRYKIVYIRVCRSGLSSFVQIVFQVGRTQVARSLAIATSMSRTRIRCGCAIAMVANNFGQLAIRTFGIRVELFWWLMF